jgi:hypothetical protein
MSAPRKASRLELAGVALLVLVSLGVAFHFTSPSVSGEVTVGRTTMQAERCSGFSGGVEIFLSGANFDAITAGAREDGSLRITYDGEEVTTCTDSVFEFTESTSGRTRRPVIGGHFHFDCTLRGEPLRGSFDFARCRRD